MPDEDMPIAPPAIVFRKSGIDGLETPWTTGEAALAAAQAFNDACSAALGAGFSYIKPNYAFPGDKWAMPTNGLPTPAMPIPAGATAEQIVDLPEWTPPEPPLF